MAFGLSDVVIGREYGLGTALRIGPAYFPTVLGGLLTVIGVISLVRSFLTPGELVGNLGLRPMLLIAVASVVTTLDGYQMARQGRAGAALATAAIGSFFAGTVATVLIVLFAPPLAEVVLKFGPADYFSLMVLGLVVAVVLAR